MFWGKLKIHVLNALNTCYRKGKLTVSLRQSVITCLPKGGKDRNLIENWRPISLLCSIYKLASAVIANRLKPHLEYIISKSQSGFIKGQRIEEGTRLVYDIMSYAEKGKIPGLLMLIDFKKAFDSVFWNFLCEVLKTFGFDKNFINWIKLFNSDISAYVIQCGFLSKPIKIERGCRQGDPISPYLFILVAEILTLMIDQNTDIKGITVGKKQIKLTQFADDTTVILDGSQKSLQATLNTLEIFGSISGLEVNKDKTKLIWIGSKINSKSRINTNPEMFWGENEFTLLGITFSTDLNNISKMNFEKVLLKAKAELNSWKYRILTPIGKITVLKTLILPKFIHLFSSVPTPNSILNEINKLFYNYLWNGKPDKVSRKTVSMNYNKGGLKMINIFNFEKSMKLKWLKYIIFQTEHTWSDLLMSEIQKLDNINIYGGQWLLNFQQVLNPFWNAVFKYWSELCAKQKIKSNEDICNSSIWFNKQLGARYTFYLNWSRKGINVINDIIDNRGNVLSQDTLTERYKININFLHYYSIKRLVKAFIEKHKKGNNFVCTKPYVPFHLKIIMNSMKNKREIYEAMSDFEADQPGNEIKWNSEFGTEQDSKNWQHVYNICFNTIKNNTYIWFQYRIIQRILGTNHFLKKN